MLIKSLAILLSSLLMMHISNAQLCQGSLGDPIINITFGSGSNPGPSLTAAATNYNYYPSDCPNDGSYTVINRTSNCFGNSWHSLSADHTGDANGYFMLVNASVQPSAFYLDTVRGLCGNTTYEFAAWVMNVLLPASCNAAGNQPNLTFQIERTDGTLLQSYNSGNIASATTPTWKQYGFFFTTPPAGSDIVLRIFNNAPGGCGNDLALDDITFRPCGPLITNTITGNSGTTSFCEGTNQQFMLNCQVSGGFTTATYQWQIRTPQNNNVWTDLPVPGNTNSLNYVIVATAPPGIYEARLAVAESGNLNSLQCRIYSKPFTFTVNANPVTTVVNDGPVCEGSIANITATGGAQYAWTGPNLFTSSGSPLSLGNVQQSQAGKYYVVVSSAAGCIHKDSTTLVVNPAPSVNVSTSSTICIEDSVQLEATGGVSYLWIPSSGLSNATIYNPKASPATTTEYSVVIANQFNCKDTAFTTVNVLEKPLANAGPDRIILEGQSIQLLGSVTTGTGYSIAWTPTTDIDNVNILEPTVDPPVDTKYILNVVSDFGCGASTDTMFVKVYKNIYVPNAFSPNGDGLNDTWNIPALAAYPSFEVAVYSRWGQLVFHAKNTLKPWDGTFKGKPLPMGAYNYFIDVGISQNLFKGSLMIIR